MSDRKYQKYRRLPFRIGTTRGKTFCCLWAEHRPDDAHTFHKNRLTAKDRNNIIKIEIIPSVTGKFQETKKRPEKACFQNIL